MNAANNLALMQIGPAVADHDSQAMNEPATKQDLYNMGIQIDSNFGKVISQFTIVDSQLVILRTDMNAGFDRVDGQFTNLRTDMDAKFTKVDSQITNLRTDMDAGFDKVDREYAPILFSPTTKRMLSLVPLSANSPTPRSDINGGL